LTEEFYQIFKEELIIVLLKLFQKTEEEGKLLSSFCEVRITDTKTRQRHGKKKENYRPISLMNIDVKSSIQY